MGVVLLWGVYWRAAHDSFHGGAARFFYPYTLIIAPNHVQ